MKNSLSLKVLPVIFLSLLACGGDAFEDAQTDSLTQAGGNGGVTVIAGSTSASTAGHNSQPTKGGSGGDWYATAGGSFPGGEAGNDSSSTIGGSAGNTQGGMIVSSGGNGGAAMAGVGGTANQGGNTNLPPDVQAYNATQEAQCQQRVVNGFPPGTMCPDNSSVARYTAGYMDCYDLASDDHNCGACGKMCDSTQICKNSECVADPSNSGDDSGGFLGGGPLSLINVL